MAGDQPEAVQDDALAESPCCEINLPTESVAVTGRPISLGMPNGVLTHNALAALSNLASIRANNAAAAPGLTSNVYIPSIPLVAPASGNQTLPYGNVPWKHDTLNNVRFAMPKTMRETPDVLYPATFDFVGQHINFHIIVWTIATEAVENDVQFEFDRTGRLFFAYRADRTRFLRWWNRYISRFIGETPRRVLLPMLIGGQTDAYVLQRPSEIDKLIFEQHSDLSPTIGGTAQFADRLNLDIREWAWIVQNCTSRVSRAHGYWVFSSRKDAALFILFHQDKSAK